MDSAGPEDQVGRLSSSSLFSSGESVQRRTPAARSPALPRPHRDSDSPALNRCLTWGYEPPQEPVKRCHPHCPRAETVAAPRTPQPGASYRGAAILVSHDSRFLRRVTRKRPPSFRAGQKKIVSARQVWAEPSSGLSQGGVDSPTAVGKRRKWGGRTETCGGPGGAGRSGDCSSQSRGARARRM